MSRLSQIEGGKQNDNNIALPSQFLKTTRNAFRAINIFYSKIDTDWS